MRAIRAGLAAAALAWQPAHALGLEAALVGDDSRQVAFAQIARDFQATVAQVGALRRATAPDGRITLTVAVGDGRDPVRIANQLLTADVALLVVDASQGPLPIVREHLLLARQAGVGSVVVLFARTRELREQAPHDAAELLELEELEMRELLSAYKVGGPDTLVWVDSPADRANRADAPTGLRRLLATGVPRRPVDRLRPMSEFAGSFYLLTEQESRERQRAVTLADGSPIDVWLAGMVRPARVRTTGLHGPGDAPSFTLQLQSPAPAAQGLRVLLLKGGVVVGVGVVSCPCKPP